MSMSSNRAIACTLEMLLRLFPDEQVNEGKVAVLRKSRSYVYAKHAFIMHPKQSSNLQWWVTNWLKESNSQRLVANSFNLRIWAATRQNKQSECAPSEDWSDWVDAQGWPESSLGAHSLCWFCHVAAHFAYTYCHLSFSKNWFFIN